jgi:MerR family transcriptional regulator, thiopeptide resistance regulator
VDQTVPTEQRRWRVGEVARRTGLSVRALRHYDEIGLLAPFDRSPAGYRLYSDGDVRRLYRIVALRQLGMGLEEIGRILDSAERDLRETVRHQLEALDRQRELQDRLRARLQTVLAALDHADEPTTELFIEAIEVTIRMQKYYNAEQLERLAERKCELGPELIEQTQHEWGELIAEVRRERAQGTDPTSPRVLALARRWQQLVARFTGGDPGIRASLAEMYQNEPVEVASRGALDSGDMDYIGKAIQALSYPQ